MLRGIMEPPYHLCEQQYDSAVQLEVFLHAHACEQGYGFVRRRTIKNTTGLRKIWMACDRNNGRKQTAIARKTSSRGTGCSMRVVITRTQDLIDLRDKLSLKILDPDHNHLASLARSAHPQYRKLASTPEVKALILQASQASVSPRRILTMIRHIDHQSPLQRQDVYNTLRDARLESLHGRSRLESLVDDLAGESWTWKMKTGETGEVSHFFFTTPQAIDLLRDYPDVLLMDCTYKTNRFKMPLLVIVGVTPLSTTYYVAFAFLRGEKQEDYAWAMEQLHDIYVRQLNRLAGPTTVLTDRELALSNALADQWPAMTHLLCVWHINKGVQAKCKLQISCEKNRSEFFDRWQLAVNAATVEAGLAAWRDLIRQYSCKYPRLIEYIESTWLRWKEKFWISFTSRTFSLGNRATSCVEGAHAGLKDWLDGSQGDFKRVKECTNLLLAAQQENLWCSRSRSFSNAF